VASANIFVRGLWGDGSCHSYPEALRRFAALSHFRFRKPNPTRYYCWGKWNLDFLRRLKIEAVLVEENAISSFGRDVPRDTSNNGRQPYGLSLWRHKLEAMRLALVDHEAITWLDADIEMTRGQGRLPRKYWEQLSKGQPLRAVQRRYVRQCCPWRDDENGRRITVHGAVIYCRETAIIERAIDLMESSDPKHTDEAVFSMFIDEQNGGQWTGEEGHRNAGYDFPWYDQRRRHVLPVIEPVHFMNRGHY